MRRGVTVTGFCLHLIYVGGGRVPQKLAGVQQNLDFEIML